MTFDLGETPEVMGGVEVMSQGVQVKDIPETSRDVPTVRSFLGIAIAIAQCEYLILWNLEIFLVSNITEITYDGF